MKTAKTMYRVTHLLASLVWVDFDLGCSTNLPSQFFQFLISPGTIGQTVEHSKFKSTQPRFARRWVTLYGLCGLG